MKIEVCYEEQRLDLAYLSEPGYPTCAPGRCDSLKRQTGASSGYRAVWHHGPSSAGATYRDPPPRRLFLLRRPSFYTHYRRVDRSWWASLLLNSRETGGAFGIPDATPTSSGR